MTLNGLHYNVLSFPEVFINEAENDQAAQALDIALTYIKKNPSLGMSVQLITVEGNRTDSRKFLENSMIFLIGSRIFKLDLEFY